MKLARVGWAASGIALALILEYFLHLSTSGSNERVKVVRIHGIAFLKIQIHPLQLILIIIII